MCGMAMILSDSEGKILRVGRADKKHRHQNGTQGGQSRNGSPSLPTVVDLLVMVGGLRVLLGDLDFQGHEGAEPLVLRRLLVKYQGRERRLAARSASRCSRTAADKSTLPGIQAILMSMLRPRPSSPARGSSSWRGNTAVIPQTF